QRRPYRYRDVTDCMAGPGPERQGSAVRSGHSSQGGDMLRKLLRAGVAVMAALLCSTPVIAQITTGTVTGNVKDPTGAVIPGATVVLISETRATRSAPAVTNENGDFVFPNVTADIYTVEVTLEGFKTAKRGGIQVSGADRVGIPAVTLEAGAIAETVTVVGQSPLVQTQSG